MHERSLVAALLQQIDRVVGEQGAERAVEVRVSVGQFAGVDEQLFCLAFEQLSQTSEHEGPRLELTTTPLVARCEECGHEFQVEHFRFHCPCCESGRVAVVRGEGMVLESVIVEGCAV